MTAPHHDLDHERDLIDLVRDARPHLFPIGQETEAWLDRLEKRHEALHTLVDDRLQTEPPTGASLVATLWRFWWLRGHMAAGRAFLERAVLIESPERQEILKGLGTIAFREGDADRADRAFSERLRLLEPQNEPRKLADAFADLARIALRRGDFAAVRKYAERGYAAAQGLGPEAIRGPLHLRAAAARMEGQLDEARALYLESRAINEQLGNELNVAGEDHNLIDVALHMGDREEAERRFRSSSQWTFDHNNAYLRPYALLDAGVLALHDGELERACRLVAAAQRIFEETGSIPDPDDRVELDKVVADLRKQLGERFGDLWQEGMALRLEEAQTLARRASQPAVPGN